MHELEKLKRNLERIPKFTFLFLQVINLNRVDRGWNLYLQGAVTVDFIAADSMAFDVKSSSGKEIYKVDMMDDTWNCSCHDFHNRNKRESTKQLICMHIHASMFKLAELYRFEELKKGNYTSKKRKQCGFKSIRRKLREDYEF
jgi:hypothetical protein